MDAMFVVDDLGNRIVDDKGHYLITDGTFSAGLSRDQTVAYVAPTVWGKASWSDSWTNLTATQGVYCDSLDTRLAPSIGKATLSYEFGKKFPHGSAISSTFSPLNINRWWIRIDVPVMFGDTSGASFSWYGVVVVEHRRTFGDQAASVLSGRQQFTAMAVTWLLSRIQVLTSVVKNAAGGNETINRGVPFNGGPGWSSLDFKNKHPTETVFCQDFRTAVEWTADDAVQYLVDNISFTDSDEVKLYLPKTTKDALKWYKPNNVATHGRTLWDILNQLIDRRRGLQWSFRINPNANLLELHVHTASSAQIGLPSGELIPLNSRAISLNVDSQADVSVDEVFDTSTRYQQIIVQGDWRTSTFTLSFADGTLDNGWTAAEETGYKQAASVLPGYGSLTREQQARFNDAVRVGELYRHVYASYEFVDTAGGAKAGDGEGGDLNIIFPHIEDDGELSDPLVADQHWHGAIAFERFTRLREGFDYSADVTNPTITMAATITPKYLPAIALVKMGGNGIPTEWESITHNAAYAVSDTVAGQRNDSGTIAVEGGENEIAGTLEMGEHGVIYLRSPGVPHQYAGDDFGMEGFGAGNTDAISNQPFSTVDYNNFAFTVTAKNDAVVEVKWPASADAAINNQTSKHYIRLGDRARLDYILEGTILGTDGAGALIKAPSNGFIRDDRPWMKDVARAAYEWYSRDRVSLQLTFQSIVSELMLGDLIIELSAGTANQRTVNTVISGIRWDFTRPSTTIRTNFLEIDDAVFSERQPDDPVARLGRRMAAARRNTGFRPEQAHQPIPANL